MPHILVVEDSPTQAHKLAFFLEDAGFTVVVAPDAEQAYRRLAGETFDAVLTDLMLPGESGFDLCRRLKADARLRRVPVIVLTSQADPVNVLRGLEAGADGFMTKDHGPEEIIGRLQRTLEQDFARAEGDEGAVRVVFLDGQFEVSAGRQQLLNVLLSAFEDVIHLNEKFQAGEAAQRQLNAQLREAVRSERAAHEALKQAQSQLVQAEKLSALGQMVAGVAHEINNPLAFVGSNLTVLQRDFAELRDLVKLYQEGHPTLAAHQPDLLKRIEDLSERIDLAYTLENLPGLLKRSGDGLVRIRQIVQNLRDFARLDESERKEANLNDGITATLPIVQGKARDKGVEIVPELAPLPALMCYPAQLNQVVLNLVANALDATPRGGRVTVRTRARPDGVEIHVLDTGTGIDPAVRGRIFDPFFTTKPQGQGTGLGLSISYGIVKNHGGRIDVESEPGKGAHFTVFLPFPPREKE